QKQAQELKETYLTQQSKLETQTKDLQSAQRPGEEQVQSLSEEVQKQVKQAGGQEPEQSIRSERRGVLNAFRDFVEDKLRLLSAKHREGGDQRARETDRPRGELEAGLAGGPCETSLETRTLELHATQAEVMQRVQRLTETLARETKRREG